MTGFHLHLFLSRSRQKGVQKISAIYFAISRNCEIDHLIKKYAVAYFLIK